MSDVSPEKWEKERLRPKYMKLLLPPTAMGGVGDREKSPDGHQPTHPKLKPLQPRKKPTKPLLWLVSLSLCLSVSFSVLPFSEASCEPSTQPQQRGNRRSGRQTREVFASTMRSNPWIKRPSLLLPLLPPTPALKSAACSPRPPLPQKVGYQPSC